MKRLVKVLIFILAFQMEIRVRASGVLEQPTGCLKSSESCAIQAPVGGFHLETSEVRLHATAKSSLVRLSAERWRLVEGILWVEKGKTQVETPYAEMKSAQGQFWLIDQGESVLVRNMNADLQVVLRDGKTLTVPEGFEFWIAGVDSQGKSDYGMIRPIDLKQQLPLWNSLYRGNKEEFRKDVQAFRDNWGDLAVKSGQIYKEIVDRQIASEAQKKKELERLQRLKAEENRRIKELYWQRTFER